MKTRLLLITLAATALGGQYNSPPVPRDGPPPPPPAVGIDQRLGARVPLHLPFKDEAGRRVTLADCTAGKPTILVLAYYRCPMLCTQVLNGLLAALRALPADVGSSFDVVVVSFDPREKPPLAALKKAAYVEQYGRPGAGPGWHFLTGDPLAVAALADATGFRTEYDPATEQYAHGSGIMVLAPDGTITRYLLGVRFEPRDLKLALAEASEGKVGSPVENAALLLCYRYDPATGTYTFAIMRAVKWFSAAALLGLVALVVVLARRARNRAARSAPQPEGLS